MSPPHRNAALISNTMLCEVSRLLSAAATPSDADWMDRRLCEIRLADLTSLIEAICLHDHLYTLPARLSDDADSLELRTLLLAKGIVSVLDTSSVHQSLAGSIVNTLAATRDLVTPEDRIEPIEFAGRLREEVVEFLGHASGGSAGPACADGNDPQLDESNAGSWIGGYSAENLNVRSLNECGQLLIGWLAYSGSGAYRAYSSVLRDMYYVLAAEAFELPYWPQATRREFASNFPNFLSKGALLQLYTRLAEAFRSTVTDVYDDHKDEVAFIPPFSTLVLQRARDTSEIPAKIVEVRDEYADLRNRLGELDQERAQARTIAGRLKVRKRQRYMLNEVSGAFDRPGVISLEGVVRYVPAVVAPILKPADPTSYTADLLLMPAKQLIRWWRRRPLSKFFRLADCLANTEDYPDLLRRLFGEGAGLVPG
jgi:hypothetical protein